LQGIGLFRLAGNDDDFGEAVAGDQFGEHRQPFFGGTTVRRKPQVQQHHLRAVLHKCINGPHAIFRQENLVFLAQCPFHLGANLLVVVHNQQSRQHNYKWRIRQIGNSTRNRVPLPGSLWTSMRPRWASTIILQWNMPMPMPFCLVV